MSVFVLTAPTVLVDEFSLTSLVDGPAVFDVTANMVERPKADGGGFRHYLPGLVNCTSTFGGAADPADAGLTDLAEIRPLSQRIISSTPDGGATVGGPWFGHRGYVQSVQVPTGGVGELAKFSISAQSTDPALVGYVGAPLASRTTTGFTGAAVAVNGPVANRTLVAALHVTAAAGTNLVVKVQSDNSSGFPSPTDRITFSTMSAVGSQWGSVSGDLSTETHWRVIATIATGTFTFACGFGVA